MQSHPLRTYNTDFLKQKPEIQFKPTRMKQNIAIYYLVQIYNSIILNLEECKVRQLAQLPK